MAPQHPFGVYPILLSNNWFERGDILIMDNASIPHGEADTVEDLLWHDAGPGRLPANGPRAQPIELVFHILARWIRHFRYREMAGPCDKAVSRPDLPGLGRCP
jgi:hypothetical protein